MGPAGVETGFFQRLLTSSPTPCRGHSCAEVGGGSWRCRGAVGGIIPAQRCAGRNRAALEVSALGASCCCRDTMRKKILIVEDDTDLLEVMRLSLKSAGYSIATATNGIEALRKARTLTPDLIVLDLPSAKPCARIASPPRCRLLS
jgi:hypothetical protein